MAFDVEFHNHRRGCFLLGFGSSGGNTAEEDVVPEPRWEVDGADEGALSVVFFVKEGFVECGGPVSARIFLVLEERNASKGSGACCFLEYSDVPPLGVVSLGELGEFGTV